MEKQLAALGRRTAALGAKDPVLAALRSALGEFRDLAPIAATIILLPVLLWCLAAASS